MNLQSNLESNLESNLQTLRSKVEPNLKNETSK